MLKCTKFDFGWGSAQTPLGGAYSAPPDLLAGFNGPTSKGRGEGREGEGREGERGREGRKGRGGKQLSCPPMQISGYATVLRFSSVQLLDDAKYCRKVQPCTHGGPTSQTTDGFETT